MSLENLKNEIKEKYLQHRIDLKRVLQQRKSDLLLKFQESSELITAELDSDYEKLLIEVDEAIKELSLIELSNDSSTSVDCSVISDSLVITDPP
jgi:hypothetical protein